LSWKQAIRPPRGLRLRLRGIRAGRARPNYPGRRSFFIGPNFAGSGSGDKGFRLNQSAGGENFSQNLNYSFYYSTPNETQTKSTVLTDRLSANASLDLLGTTGGWPEGRQGRSFNLSGSMTFSNRKEVTESPDLDESSQSVTGSCFTGTTT